MSGLPQLHTPKEVADALGCSEWWVKERARRRQIPYVLVGGAYKFSDEHFDQILAIFEQLPEPTASQPASPPRRRAQPRSEVPANHVVPLRARPSRRSPKAG